MCVIKDVFRYCISATAILSRNRNPRSHLRKPSLGCFPSKSGGGGVAGGGGASFRAEY